MALLNGQTPEEMAADIIESLEDQVISISGIANEDLKFLVRSKNVQVIMARGEKWFDGEYETFAKSFLSDTIHNLAKAKRKYLQEKEATDQFETYRLLVSRGMAAAEASKIAYPSGVPAPRNK
jgi:hypothetical protein